MSTLKKLLVSIAFLLSLFSLVNGQVSQVPGFVLSGRVNDNKNTQKVEPNLYNEDVYRSVRQGDVLIATLSPYRGPDFFLDFADRTGQTKTQKVEPNNEGVAYVGIDPEMPPGKHDLCLVDGRRYIYWYCVFVEVLDRKFEEVKVKAKKHVINIPGRKYEIKEINEAYKKADSYQIYARGEYAYPLDVMFPTQEFYKKTFFINGLKVHEGVDLRASVGTPARAINVGKVIMTALRFSLEGNMVIVDHGSGILSFYMHLSRINVHEGQIVKAGEIIGLSGDTGLGVTGPHLHFVVKVNGIVVDPLEFIKTMNEISK